MKAERKYYIRQYSYADYFDGGIGYVDAERILASEGFEAISFPGHFDNTLLSKLKRLLYLLKVLISVKKDSIVVFIFPLFARINKLLLAGLIFKRVNLVCYLADIDGIKDGDKMKLAAEIRVLKRFKFFILHNDKMKLWLDTVLPGKVSEVVEFFDFLSKSPDFNQHFLSSEIVFAGNLSKSPFLEQLYLLEPGSLYFHLYGPNHTEAMLQQPNVSWNGVEKPYALPQKIKGSFGLVWDGIGITSPSGSLGEYMKYISHHKLSLYIISGIPLIVPAMGASALLVEKYKIGFCIDSLFDIENKIKTISPDDYKIMQENLKPLADKISQGSCLKEALAKLIFQIKQVSDS